MRPTLHCNGEVLVWRGVVQALCGDCFYLTALIAAGPSLDSAPPFNFRILLYSVESTDPDVCNRNRSTTRIHLVDTGASQKSRLIVGLATATAPDSSAPDPHADLGKKTVLQANDESWPYSLSGLRDRMVSHRRLGTLVSTSTLVLSSQQRLTPRPRRNVRCLTLI